MTGGEAVIGVQDVERVLGPERVEPHVCWLLRVTIVDQWIGRPPTSPAQRHLVVTLHHASESQAERTLRAFSLTRHGETIVRIERRQVTGQCHCRESGGAL